MPLYVRTRGVRHQRKLVNSPRAAGNANCRDATAGDPGVLLCRLGRDSGMCGRECAWGVS